MSNQAPCEVANIYSRFSTGQLVKLLEDKRRKTLFSGILEHFGLKRASKEVATLEAELERRGFYDVSAREFAALR